jgi:O-antigen/teichoic acid export membrane protein
MLLRHSAIYLLARGLPGLINLLAMAVYTRLLAPDDYGRYALVIAGVGLGNKLVFEWLRLSLLRFLPALPGRSQAALRATIGGAFLGLVAVTAVVAGVALVALSDPVLRDLVTAGIALLWIQALFELELDRLRSQLLPHRYGLTAVGRAILSLAFGVAFVTLGLGVFGLILGLILAMIIAGSRSFLEEIRSLRLSEYDRALMGQLFRYGAPLAVTAALSFVIASSDRFLIGWLLSDDAVGRYAVGYDLASASVELLFTIVNLAGYPLVVRALEEHGTEAARRQLTFNLIGLLAVGLPATIGFAVLARPLAGVLLGQQFRADAVMLIPWIAVASLLACIKAFYLDLAFQLGRSTIGQIWITMAAAAANILLNFWWIPIVGLAGAAYATVAAYALALLLSGIFGRRVFALPCPIVDSLKVILAAAGMGAIVWQLTGFAGAAALIAQVLCGALVYGILIWLFNPAEVRSRLPEIVEWVRQTVPGK